MGKTGMQLDFLLGAVSPMGFAGYFNQVLGVTENKHSVLIKAGPGCGKSTLMKKIASQLCEKGFDVELIHCSSDPDSLDGVICPATGFSIVDATAPHTLEPLYPIACEEILSLYHLIDEEKMKAVQKEVVTLFNRCSNLQERAARYITAAGSLIADSARVANCAADFDKIQQYAEHLCQKYLPRTDTAASEEIRLLSATTLNGELFYIDTLYKLCKSKLVVFDDEYGAASKAILKQIRDNALSKGYAIITCYCPMAPHEKIDHIIIPALGLGFATSNSFHTISSEGRRIIHCARFMNQEILKLRRQRLKFNKKAASELFMQANMLQKEAKQNHDKLETYYKAAIDFDGVNKICDELLKKI